MNPEERQMITGLFDRMRQQGIVDKDRDADALIRDTVRQMPDAPYVMVQTILVQEMALQNAQQQIQDLEDRVRNLEAQSARPAQQSSGGSFLGGLFGGGSKPAAVPAAGRQSGSFGSAAPQRAGSPWGNAPGGGAPQQGGYAPQQGGMMPMQQQAPAGGGFMKSAMATAAGVAGGMLAANAISNMMNGGSSAHAASANKPASDGNDPAGSYAQNSDGNDPAGSYAQADEGNDPSGSYDSADDQGGYDDGGSWSDE